MSRRPDRPRLPFPRLITTLVIAALVVPAIAALVLGAPQSASAAAPVFAEEFSYGPLDSSVWAVETPWHTHSATGELQYYDSSALSFVNRGLRITSSEASMNGFGYVSGMITTGSHYGGVSRRAFRYGYFEMRAKLPKGQGIWPAFWLTNDDTSEIDVMEMLGKQPNKVYMALHSTANGVKTARQRYYVGPDFSAGYHRFAVDWQPTYVRYYIDGILRAQFTGNIPSEPLWIVANTAVGGAWGGLPDATTRFPQYYDIDYIRVWNRRPW